MLEAAGLTDPEERVYLALVGRRSETASALADATKLSPGAVHRTLLALLEMGLVTRPAGRRGQYAAVPPNVALHGLIDRRKQELGDVSQLIRRLQEQFAVASEATSPEHVVEIVSGGREFAERYLQIRKVAGSEWLAMDKPPYITADKDCLDSASEQLARSLPTRVLYDEVVLERPGRLEDIMSSIDRGRKARVMRDLPLKLAVADRRFGLIPLSVEPGREAALLLHASPLLDALVGLFNALWEKAMPLSGGNGGEGVGDRADDARLLVLIGAGLTDDAIAARLGIAARTVRRRVSGLMVELGATTRFQLGYQAAKRGWL